MTDEIELWQVCKGGGGRQDSPAHMQRHITTAKRQCEWRLHQRVCCNAAKASRHRAHVPLARVPDVLSARPHDDRAFAANIAQINPGRAARVAVDKHARLLARVMSDVAALPPAPDHVGEWPPGCGAKAARDLVGQPVSRIKRSPVAVVDVWQKRVVRREYSREPRKDHAP